MKKWLKRIRGAVGTALTWAVVWGGVGGLLGALFWAVGGGSAMALAMFTNGALAGFVLGGSFSVTGAHGPISNHPKLLRDNNLHVRNRCATNCGQISTNPILYGARVWIRAYATTTESTGPPER